MIVNVLNRDRINAPNYDQALLWVTLILLGIGLVMVYSASIAIAEADKAVGNNSSYYLMRQAVFIVISLVAAVVAFNVP
ncbi:MAG: FtsW/RodA/SpoVE family cell cycle protein, partial [Methylotenera sp.]